MTCKERLKDYLEGYGSQYNFKDENNIEHYLNDDIEEMLKQNQKLENALDEIENYLNANDYEYIYLDCKLIETKIYTDLKEIIKKAKGE